MSNHYLLYPDQSGLNGVPVFMDARLWESIDNKDNLMAPYRDYYNWDTYEYKLEEFPEKLYFIVKEKKILFDYYPFRSGLIVSQLFLDLLSDVTNSFSYVPLEIYSDKHKPITKKKYYFLKFHHYLVEGFNYQKSVYTPNKSDNNQIISINKHPWIERVDKLELNEFEIQEKDIFCLHGWIFFNKPFFSKRMVKLAIERELYGIKYVAAHKLVEFYNNRQYLQKSSAIIS